jgi:uncharacterized protein
MTGDIWWSDLYEELQPGSADFFSLALTNLFANGKFITLFSVLFGIGFYVQCERRLANNENVSTFWLRRLSGLLMIGVLANACTIPAWILVDYALFGVGLLLCYKLSARNVIIAAIACFAISKLFGSIIPAYSPSAVSDAPSVLDTVRQSVDIVQRDGSFLDVAALRLLHMWEELTDWHYYRDELDILGLMLIGLHVGKRGAIRDHGIRVQMARRALPWLLSVGFVSCAVWVAMQNFGLGNEDSVHHEVIRYLFAWPVGMPLLGLGYAAAITLLIRKEAWRRRLAGFAPVGRMALTNYLFTGFVSAFISFQWGLGLYGQVFPAVGLMIVLVLLPLQMLASRWWLNRFAFGPFEWLWRAWTYRRFPPMRQQRDLPLRAELDEVE